MIKPGSDKDAMTMNGIYGKMCFGEKSDEYMTQLLSIVEDLSSKYEGVLERVQKDIVEAKIT